QGNFGLALSRRILQGSALLDSQRQSGRQQKPWGRLVSDRFPASTRWKNRCTSHVLRYEVDQDPRRLSAYNSLRNILESIRVWQTGGLSICGATPWTGRTRPH